MQKEIWWPIIIYLLHLLLAIQIGLEVNGIEIAKKENSIHTRQDCLARKPQGIYKEATRQISVLRKFTALMSEHKNQMYFYKLATNWKHLTAISLTTMLRNTVQQNTYVLFTQNYRTLMRYIKDLNKWRDLHAHGFLGGQLSLNWSTDSTLSPSKSQHPQNWR